MYVGLPGAIINGLLNVKLVLLTFLFFIYTFVLLYVSGSYALECGARYPRSGKVSYKYYNDGESDCNGHSFDVRMKEQKRILASVRRELLDSSKKLEEVNKIIDDLNRKIPEKQQELQLLHEAKESAERALQDLKDRRNVRVSLPHSPLFHSPTREDTHNEKTELIRSTNEEVFDYSRCSITSFLPLFLESYGEPHSFFEELKRQGNIVEDRKKACLTIIVVNSVVEQDWLQDNGLNTVVLNFGNATKRISDEILVQPLNRRRYFDESIYLNIPIFDPQRWKELPTLLPYSRKFLFSWVLFDETIFDKKSLDEDIDKIFASARNSSDVVSITRCKLRSANTLCEKPELKKKIRLDSVFCFVMPDNDFHKNFWESLASGCIPIVFSNTYPLPFDAFVDWRLASYRLDITRLPEVHFILRSFEMADVLEMKRMGRIFFEKYLMDQRVVVKTLLTSLAHKIGVPLYPLHQFEAIPLFDQSFTAPVLVPVNLQPFDDEYLGPLEAPHESARYLHNFTSLQLYSSRIWNDYAGSDVGSEYLPFSVDPPTESEFYPDSNSGFRAIEPGSGVEFSKNLGGNRPREQFTVVILTYKRDTVLAAALERLHRLPYLQKVIVIWHNLDRSPAGAWPRLHVPVEFLKVDKNSLNNRFIPWNRIETESVLSLDDDIDLKHYEIIFAFRVWRENRDRIVGFPARFHARFGDSMFYNSNHTCQLSLILTGASFLHKSYLNSYTSGMPAEIRDHVDKVMNCEDIAMNFLVSHLTRKPPIKTTSKWTLRCAQCTETLSEDNDHFQKRHECIRLFTKIYGYNPLKFSQYRADSVLFKTRLPADKQKCFKYV
ncbi:unnamed protein product [Auanema sp. JU1783]|nr:unnamed protein product [Auanema sp. JU1783]